MNHLLPSLGGKSGREYVQKIHVWHRQIFKSNVSSESSKPVWARAFVVCAAFVAAFVAFCAFVWAVSGPAEEFVVEETIMVDSIHGPPRRESPSERHLGSLAEALHVRLEIQLYGQRVLLDVLDRPALLMQMMQMLRDVKIKSSNSRAIQTCQANDFFLTPGIWDKLC